MIQNIRKEQTSTIETMTPLSKDLEHLYNATWVVIDPWSTQFEPREDINKDILTHVNNVNNYYAHMIHEYIQTHNINNVYIVNNHGIPTHPLFENYPKWPGNLPEGDYVFVGYHSGICIKQKGTEKLKATKDYIPWVKADLTCTLPTNWLTAETVEQLQYTFKDHMDMYGDRVNII